MKDITELRTLIGEVLAGVKDGTLGIEQAKTIKGLADSLIDSAKVEVEFCRVTDTLGSGFIPTQPTPHPPALAQINPLPEGTTTIERPGAGTTREITQATGYTRTVNKVR